VDGKDFTQAGVINDPKLENCRQFVGINAEKAYVTCWGNAENPSVAVVDLNTRQVLKNIPTGKKPEAILLDNSYAYVANSDDKTITVINTQTDAVFTELEVKPNPVGMAVDRNARLWVLCNGDPASLVSFNLTKWLVRHLFFRSKKNRLPNLKI
jgi:YVTN family beta-propeller protein